MVNRLDDIIEHNVDESLYLTKSDCEKRKYLKNSLDICCTIRGDDVFIFKDDITPPRILKIKRTEEEKQLRKIYGDGGVKFGRGKYVYVTKQDSSNTLTTFASDNYIWDRNFKIRELTARESFRLMGVGEENINKILECVPKSQCRKLAGNSICVGVMREIFKNLFVTPQKNPENSLF